MKHRKSPPKLFLTRFNRRFWQLLITPVFTLLYAPVNRHVILPRFGSGRPYTDLSGQLIESYFSANSVALLLFYLLGLVTLVLSVLQMKKLPAGKGRKAGYLLLCILVSLFSGLLFLEFSLWA